MRDDGAAQLDNAVVSAIVARAEGLPLYVHHVLEDLRSGHFRFADLPHKLPRGLSAYYDDLLRRMSISDLHAVLTPLIVTLAWAEEPLGEQILQLLLHRRKVFATSETGRRLLSKALVAVQSMIRRRGPGYGIYHPTFREHIRRDEDDARANQNKLARDEFTKLAKGWRELDRGTEAHAYALRHGPAHLAANGETAALKELLSDYRYLEAKVEFGLLNELIADYDLAAEDGELKLIQGALLLSSHVIGEDPHEFASQMTGRLLAHAAQPGIAAFLERIHTSVPRPWIRPLHPCFDSPGGALLRTLEGHSEAVNGVAVTPDGKQAVSASSDKTLKVWDLETGRALRTLEGHSRWVNGVAVTPDGKRAVSASRDYTLKVWDLETGRAPRTLEGHSEAVNGVAVMPDGKRAVSASSDKTLKAWDLKPSVALRTLEGHSKGVRSVAVTADGKWAVSASDDRTLKMWELETGHALRTLVGGFYSGAVLTPDGKRAVSDEDHTLRVWDLETGRALRTLEGYFSGFGSGVVVTQDGKRAIFASHDNTLKVWDLETGHALCKPRNLEGHAGHFCRVNGVAVTPDGKRAISAYDDKTLTVWDLKTGLPIATFRCEAEPLCCAFPDERRTVAGDFNGRVYFLALEE